MTTPPTNLPPSPSGSPTTSGKSGITSAQPAFRNPFLENDPAEVWKALRAERGNVVTREEMIRRVQEQARQKK